MLLALARNTDKVLNESLVTAASITLIAVSIMWVVFSRLVLRNLRKAARVREPAPARDTATTIKRDIWREPPPG